MSAQSKTAVLSAIQNRDYVKAVSQADLLGNPLDAFTIRIALSAVEESKVRLLLEAYLIEQFSSYLEVLATGTSVDDTFRNIGVIVEITIHCNVFLNIEISCERLIQKSIAIYKFCDDKLSLTRQRPTAVKFASSVTGGSSSSSKSSEPIHGESFWNIFALLLHLFGHTKPFLGRLLEHVLVSLRAYVHDYSQYQQFTDQLITIFRALRPDRTAPCACSKNIIPLFLASCVSEYQRQNCDQSRSPLSSVSNGSQESQIYKTEQVQEFWSIFKTDPLGLYAVFIGRLRFLADSLSDDRQTGISCLCHCHLDEWRSELLTRIPYVPSVGRKYDDQVIVDIMYFLISRMSKVLSRSNAERTHLGLKVDEILDAMHFPNGNFDESAPRSPIPIKAELFGRKMEPQFVPLDSDESTTVWSGETIRLPLQPEIDEILQVTRYVKQESDSSSSEMEVIDRKQLKERKARFNQEVLALQRRFLDSSSSSRAATNTDSDVESLPFDGATSLPAEKIPMQHPPNIQTPEVNLATPTKQPQREPLDTVDQATSPHKISHPMPIIKSEIGSQTSLQFDHAAIQTDGVLLKDAAVHIELPVTQTETQTDPSLAPILGNLVSQKEDHFLHVQDMTKRDVQRIFRSAQAFANIC